MPTARPTPRPTRHTAARRRLLRLAVAVAALLIATPAVQAVETTTDDPAPTHQTDPTAGLAIHNGRLIDMADGWGSATTCVVVPDTLTLAECFDTDAERDQRLSDLGLTARFADAEIPDLGGFGFVACSSYLKLYDGYNYSSTSLWLSTRQTWSNLSAYGFDQRASSYKVGGCSTYMADYSNGGGAWISTSLTQAWDVDAVISGSWNNDISSVYIL